MAFYSFTCSTCATFSFFLSPLDYLPAILFFQTQHFMYLFVTTATFCFQTQHFCAFCALITLFPSSRRRSVKFSNQTYPTFHVSILLCHTVAICPILLNQPVCKQLLTNFTSALFLEEIKPRLYKIVRNFAY